MMKLVEVLKDSYNFFQKDELANARKLCEEVLKTSPDNPDANALMGLIFYREKRYELSIGCHVRAIKLKPDNVQYYSNLGAAYDAAGLPREAVAAYNEAIKRDNRNADYYFNMHRALYHIGKVDAAISSLKATIKLDPKYTKAYMALTDMYQVKGDLSSVESCIKDLEKIAPDNPDVPFCKGYYLLRKGDLENGFAALESRWKKTNINEKYNKAKSYNMPMWDGHDIKDKSLLLWSEQGIGDLIMCASIFEETARLCSELVIEADGRLFPLFERSFANVKNIKFVTRNLSSNKPAADTDFHLPILSLPRWTRKRESDFSGADKYLSADSKIVSELREKYERIAGGKAKVGISWTTTADRVERPIPLHMWKDIFAVEGVEFFSLQYGDHTKEIQKFEQETNYKLNVDNSVDSMRDLERFAAQVEAMDLIISIDNSTVHMAAALGKPVWTMLTTLPDWRWMMERQDSPWYPTMSLFRQKETANWSSVIEDVSKQLKEFAAHF